MRIDFYKETFSSKSKGTFYVIRIVLEDKSGNLLKKSSPILWLTEEEYNSINVPTI